MIDQILSFVSKYFLDVHRSTESSYDDIEDYFSVSKTIEFLLRRKTHHHHHQTAYFEEK